MSKKIISLLLAVMLTVSMITVTAISVSAEEGAGTTYVVAGSEEVFGVNWDFNAETASDNVMTEVDGVYTLTLTDVAPFTNAQFKIGTNGVDGEGSIGKAIDGTASSDPGAGNYAFDVTDTCDVTITYNPATNEVTYSGEYIIDHVFSVEEMRAVGNGGSGWLNDIAWDPAADENFMEEVAPGVYEIVMYDVEGNSNAQFKFAADGSWGTNWGASTFNGFDQWNDADMYNAAGGNITIQIGEGDDDVNLYTVTLKIDISGWDDAARTGAKYFVSQKVQSEEDQTDPVTTDPVTTDPVTTDPVTTDPVTTEATTTVAGAPLTVNATSNFFSKTEASYNAETNEVTVSYYLESAKNLLNFQIGTKEVESTVIDGITYDPEVLKIADDWKNRNTLPMTGVGGCVINLRGVEGSIKLNGSNLNLWEIDPETPFVQVKFEVLDLTGKGPVTTTIGCEVESMIVANIDPNNPNEEVDSKTEDYLVRNKVAVEENIAKNNVKAVTTLTPGTYIPVETTVPETTVPETTVPETTAPETTVPETTVPETTAPETTAPETTVPETTVPETTVPETTVPETTVPETTVPETTVPETTVPDTTVAGNVITANSNLLPTDTYAAKVGEIVTVDYSLEANVLQTQWTLTYDPSVLELITTDNFMPQMTSGALYNTDKAGEVVGSASDLGLYKVTSDAPFVGAKFKKIAEGDTTVTLVVSVLKTAELNEDGTVKEDSETYVVFNGQVAEDIAIADSFKTTLNAVSAEPETTKPVTTDPVTTDPVTTDPVTTDPVTTDPVTTDPVTTDPVTTDPVTTDPVTTDPVTTDPVTTDPVTTDPVTTDPATTVAPVEPDTTAPAEVPTQPATDKGSSTADTPNNNGTADTAKPNGNGAVQTGDASMAIIILSVLVAGTGVMFVLRKREMF